MKQMMFRAAKAIDAVRESYAYEQAVGKQWCWEMYRRDLEQELPHVNDNGLRLVAFLMGIRFNLELLWWVLSGQEPLEWLEAEMRAADERLLSYALG